MIFNRQCHRLRRDRIIDIAIIGDDFLDTRSQPGWQNLHRVANTDETGFDTSHVAAEIVQLLGLRPAHQLHGKPEIFEVDVVVDRNIFQQIHQRRALVPVELVPALDHHIAVQSRHRNIGDISQLESLGKSGEILADSLEYFAGIIHQIHLVNRHHQMRNADEAGKVGMPARLGEHALARINRG